MTKTIKILHYTHHPYYVHEVHEKLADVLNSGYGLQLKEPKIKKVGLWPFRSTRIVSEGIGTKIESTCRDSHDNDLYLILDNKVHPFRRKLTIQELVSPCNVESILGNPIQ